MAANRLITAGIALILTVTVASAFAADVVSNPSAAEQSVEPAAAKRKVRIIDMSSAKAVKSDQTKWYNRVPKPPVQKHAAKAETAHAEVRAEKPKKTRAVQRAAPRQDAYSAYASETTRERRGFGLFNWQ